MHGEKKKSNGNNIQSTSIRHSFAAIWMMTKRKKIIAVMEPYFRIINNEDDQVTTFLSSFCYYCCCWCGYCCLYRFCLPLFLSLKPSIHYLKLFVCSVIQNVSVRR